MSSKTLLRSFALRTALLLSVLNMGFAQSVTLDGEQWAFLSLINTFRAQNGVGPLQVSVALQTSSQWMSNDLAAKNYFSHTDSLGRSAGERIASFGYHFSPMGENIAAGNDDAQSTFNQWLTACDPDSSGACTYAHRQNMLYGGFVAIGIGRMFNANSTYGWYWTTDFGGVLDQAVTPGPTPTPSPTQVPVISHFRATPSTVTAGQSTTLTWSVTGATSLSINNGIGLVTNLTSRIVSPSQTTTYTLTAINAAGSVTASTSVTVSSPASDSQPPTAPTLVSAIAASTSQINLVWTASSDNVGVAGYQIFRNGTSRAAVGGGILSFVDTAVTAGTTYSYSIKAYDAIGNLSPASNIAQVTTAPPAPILTSCPAPAKDAFTACYYNNTVVTGGLAFTRKETQINLDSSPDAAVSSSVFSASWKGTFTFEQGNYVFNAIAADGMNIYIDGSMVLNAWQDQPTTAYSVVRTLSQGQHLITVQYFQRHNKTSAHVTWQKQDQAPAPSPVVDSQAPTPPVLISVEAKSPTQVDLAWLGSTDNTEVTGYQIFRNGAVVATVNALSYSDKGASANGNYSYLIKAVDAAGNASSASNIVYVVTGGTPIPTPTPTPSPAPGPVDCGTPSVNAFTGCYYTDGAMSGNPLVSKIDELINFDWGFSRPNPAISSSIYSVRWQGTFAFAQGEHSFTATTSDGMRMFIDGVLVLDAWWDQPVTSYTVLRTLSQGSHLITVEYYRRTGSAVAHVTWAPSDRARRR